MTIPRRLGVASAAVACGCSLLTPLSDYSSGEGLGSTDAGQSADSASAEGAAADATDAAVASDARFCDHADATFCEDWDDPATRTRWNPNAANGAAQGIDEAVASSPPASQWVTTENIGSGAIEATASLAYGFPMKTSSLSYAFDLRVDGVGTSSVVVTNAVFGQTGDNHEYKVQVVVGPTKASVDEARMGNDYCYEGHSLSRPIPTGAWTRVRVDVIVDAGGRRLRASLDDEVVLDAALVCWTGFTSGRLTYYTGAAYLRGPAAPWTYRIDSITVDTR